MSYCAISEAPYRNISLHKKLSAEIHIQDDSRGIMSLTKFSMQPTLHFRIHDAYQSLLSLSFFDLDSSK
jgi:hypothetical protein